MITELSVVSLALETSSWLYYPVVGSPFQAKFMGPYSIVNKLSEQNCIIATPDRRKVIQLCHANLLRPYHCAVPETTKLCIWGSGVQVHAVT